MPEHYNRPLSEYTMEELETILDVYRFRLARLNQEEAMVYQEMVDRTNQRPLYC